MRRVSLLTVLAVWATLVVAPSSPAVAMVERLVDIGLGFDTPLLATSPDGDDDLYVVERAGRVRRVTFGSDGKASTVTTFADIRSLVSTSGEGGLLGIAFSPDHADDGRVWLSYTDTSGNSRIDRMTLAGSGGRLDPATRVNVLRVVQPESNHNGGMIAFARDGMLLVGLGDGGGGGDPYENGQDTGTLLGSILRIDVKDRSGGGYAIPSDNPFVGRSGRDEIWAYGVRNPYRFSVDRATGDVWIGDVGQSAVEEVDRLRYTPSTAVNLGWDRWEGTRCFESCGSRTGITFPVYEYGHGEGCSVTGGYVIRGDTAPAYDGLYVFGDFCAGWVRLYDRSTDRATTLADDIGNVFGFGQDGLGTTYVLTASRVYRIQGTGTRFADVEAGTTFAASIVTLAEADVTKGCNPPTNNRFCPGDPVTREQMAAFIVRAAHLPLRAESFVDVAADDTFAGSIGGIAAAGITRGCNPPANTRFCPDRPVTRAEMAGFLARARGLSGRPETFRDVAPGDTFARSIGAIQAADITKGCNPPVNDRFCPDEVVTRQEMAAFLVRAFDL